MNLLTIVSLALTVISVPEVEGRYALVAVEDSLESVGRNLLVRRKSAPPKLYILQKLDSPFVLYCTAHVPCSAPVPCRPLLHTCQESSAVCHKVPSTWLSCHAASLVVFWPSGPPTVTVGLSEAQLWAAAVSMQLQYCSWSLL